MSDLRAVAHELMVATVKDHAHWTYHAVRPCYVPHSWKPGQHVSGDCSKGAQFIWRWTGTRTGLVVPDPMGMGWGPYGNSATECYHLDHVTSAVALEVGDLITFGWGGGEHATLVQEKGADPLLWSFGHQGAPNNYRLSQDRRVHQFLKMHVVSPPPTPQDKLRARTGYFSWVAWKLGEGAWRHYGPANPKVRPNVPKVIPLRWWKAYAAFLANRKKGDEATR